MALVSNHPPARPSWSPDGRWIAVAGIENADSQQAELIGFLTGQGRR